MVREVEFDIALSFAGEDRPYVGQVANLLRDTGVKVFYDLFEQETLWGKNLYTYLTEIYQNKARYTIMFISEHYASKRWTNHEREVMQARAFQENREYVLPARFDNTEIPGVLVTTGYIDLTTRSPEDFVKAILKKLVNTGHTVPSELVRRAIFSVERMPRVVPLTAKVTVGDSDGNPVAGASITAIANNGTTKSAKTGADGVACVNIPTRRTYQLLVAHPDHPGAIFPEWDPADDVGVKLLASENVGSIIIEKGTGYIPGLLGRLNPILDDHDRMYLYADNIAINEGVSQPAQFQINESLELEDADGVIMQVRVLFIQARTCLAQYVHATYEDQ